MSSSEWKLRPWSGFIDKERMKAPQSVEEVTQRVKANTDYYRANYAVVIMALLLAATYFYPYILIVFALTGAAIAALFFSSPQYHKIGDHKLSKYEKYGIIAVVAALSVYLSDTFFAFYWTAFFSLVAVGVHSTLMKFSLKTKLTDTVSSLKKDAKGVAKKGQDAMKNL